MPFDGRVASESVDTGQYVVAGQPLATVYGTEIAEIVVPLEDRDLAWFDLPAGFNDSASSSSVTGAEASVIADFAGGRHTWAGRVVRADDETVTLTVAPNVDMKFTKGAIAGMAKEEEGAS